MFQPFVKSQEVYRGLYVNSESNEFIYFHNDTVQLRIYNEDALATFFLGKGKYKIDKKGVMHLQNNTIIEQTSMIKKYPRKDNKVAITVLRNNDVPMPFVFIIISKNKSEDYHIESVSDKNGQLILREEQIDSLNNEKALIHIEKVGFLSEKEVFLEHGYNYEIKSRIPGKFPFTLVKKTNNVVINQFNHQCLRIEIDRRIKSKLNKVDINSNSFNFLFDKDVNDFRK